MKTKIYGDDFVSQTVEITDNTAKKTAILSLKFKPECTGIQPESTSDYIIFTNSNAINKKNRLATCDCISDVPHEIYIDGNKVETIGTKYSELSKPDNTLTYNEDNNSWKIESTAISRNGLALMVCVRKNSADNKTEMDRIITYTRTSMNEAWVKTNTTSFTFPVDTKFGQSLATDEKGLIVTIGAPRMTANNTTYAGSVFIYKRDSLGDDLIEKSKLDAENPHESDMFGSSVALSSDGLILLVGKLNESSNNNNTSNGAVYTYKRESKNDKWELVNKLTANNTKNFGMSVSVSSDGLVAIVGDGHNGHNQNGRVYTYKRSSKNSNWEKVSILDFNDPNGYAVSGGSVALSGNGLIAIIGAPYESQTGQSDNGQVFIYTRNSINDAWTKATSLLEYKFTYYSEFGTSVAISGDGKNIIITARGDKNGIVYEYKAGGLYKYDITELRLGSKPIYGYIETDTHAAVKTGNDESNLLMLPVKYIPVISKNKVNKTITIGESLDTPTKIIIGQNEIIVTDINNNKDGSYTIDASTASTVDVDYIYVKNYINIPVLESTRTTITTNIDPSLVSIGDRILVNKHEVAITNVEKIGKRKYDYTKKKLSGKYKLFLHSSNKVILTIPEQDELPTTARLFDNSRLMRPISEKLDNCILTRTFTTIVKDTKYMKNAIYVEKPNVELKNATAIISGDFVDLTLNKITNGH